MITIYDIAKKTGYSAPTVSKALNGTGGLSPETRRKILKSAEEMGYSPNMTARALSTKKSYLIGIIFEDLYMQRGFEHPLFGGVLTKFRSEVEASGYDLIFISTSFGDTKVNSYVEHCKLRNVDAVVIINPLDDYSKIIELAKSDIPCVSTNDLVPGIPAVITDNESAGFDAGEFLIKNGHTKIAYIAGSSNEYSQAADERLTGLRRALTKHNLQLEEKNIERCSLWTREAGESAMKNILSRNTDITAVFAANDNMAIGAMNYCKQFGLKVPEDISFVGFDDENFSEFYQPALTTFSQNRKLIAELSEEILMNQLIGVPVKDCIRVPADFIVRDSVRKIC